MKLAEALRERSDLNQKIHQLEARLLNNSIVQEGEKPVENPNDLLDELQTSIARLQYLISAINRTNCTAKIGDKTIMETISEKDCLQMQVGIFRQIVDRAGSIATRASRTEIKIFSAVDVSELQNRIDLMSKQIRLLDNALQATNWIVDLIE